MLILYINKFMIYNCRRNIHSCSMISYFLSLYVVVFRIHTHTYNLNL